MKMKISDILRKSNDKTMAKIIGAVIAMQIDDISEEEAVELEYPHILQILQSEIDVDYKQTNADRIRSMSDEELYNLIEKVKMCGGLLRTEESSSECKGCKDGFCCNVLHWLKSEAE